MSLEQYTANISNFTTLKPKSTEMQGLKTLNKESIRNSRDIYLGLLGTETFPQSPEDLPQKLFLPPIQIGHIDTVILETINDKENRERSQIIAWNSNMSIPQVLTGYRNWKRGERKFNFGEIYIGDNKSVKIKKTDGEGRRIWSRPLLDFHTQPNKPFFSATDIAYTMTELCPSYIQLVGSRTGLYAALLTEQFKTCKLTFKDSLEELANKGFPSEDITESTSILEEKGLGVYQWAPTHGLYVQAGDTRAGIQLKRLHAGRQTYLNSTTTVEE